MVHVSRYLYGEDKMLTCRTILYKYWFAHITQILMVPFLKSNYTQIHSEKLHIWICISKTSYLDMHKLQVVIQELADKFFHIYSK